MKALIQRVSEASVSVDGQAVSSIGRGLLVLLGVVRADGEAEADRLARKTAAMRIFPDAEGTMNLSCTDAGGDILAVSGVEKCLRNPRRLFLRHGFGCCRSHTAKQRQK